LTGETKPNLQNIEKTSVKIAVKTSADGYCERAVDIANDSCRARQHLFDVQSAVATLSHPVDGLDYDKLTAVSAQTSVPFRSFILTRRQNL